VVVLVKMTFLLRKSFKSIENTSLEGVGTRAG